MISLSIIIVNYNTKKLLGQCLQSLNPKFEMIVVDNASGDGSAEMVKKEFPKVQLVCNNENLGFAKAVNQALRLAQGEAVMLLNSDARPEEGAIDNLIEFEKKVRPAIIGARMLNPDGSIQGSVFNLPTIKRAFEEFWLGKKGCFSKYFPPGDQPVEVEVVTGGVMMISREVIKKVGMFNERYFMYFEDFDYCRRTRKAGYKVYYLPGAEVVHEHGASGKKLASGDEQWKRLLPSSKIYHGWLKHSLVNLVIWTGQKCGKKLQK